MTKQTLADFYWAIAAHMLPHIAGRPLSLVRCPEGSTKPCFYQKHVTPALPKGIGTVMVPDKKTGVPEPYITLDSREALAGLAQMGVLEVHPWGSRNDDLEHPDRIVIDLDPDESLAWPTVTEAAADVRARLKELGLESFLKTTGGKGLHVVVPITPEHDWITIKSFAHNFALAMEKSQPSLYLSKMTKSARTGKIYLDYLRNERGATAVAPYSPRARSGVPVSMPLAWSEFKLTDPPQLPRRQSGRVASAPEKRSLEAVAHHQPATYSGSHQTNLGAFAFSSVIHFVSHSLCCHSRRESAFAVAFACSTLFVIPGGNLRLPLQLPVLLVCHSRRESAFSASTPQPETL